MKKNLFTALIGGGLFGVIIAALAFPGTVGSILLGVIVLGILLAVCVFFARELYGLLFDA